jgi:hypothetical protein
MTFHRGVSVSLKGKALGKDVDSIVKQLKPDQKKIAEKFRSIVKETLPDAVETVKWGNIMYVYNGQNLSWFLFYKDHADFGFFKGAQLKSKFLEGTGKGLRHIKVRSLEGIDEAEFSRLLKDASKLTA